MPRDDWRKANARAAHGPAGGDHWRHAAPVKKGVACPRCGAEMVLRRNSQTGDPFLGCVRFSETGCRGSRPAEAEPVRREPPKRKRKKKKARRPRTAADRHLDELAAEHREATRKEAAD